MNKYIEIANKIENIVRNDYSGCLDKKSIIDANKIILKENITKSNFSKSVSKYLRLFKDNHLILVNNSNEVFSNGFATRRYEEKLIVTEVFQDIDLEVGDEISHLDDMHIKDLELKYKDYFYSEIKERQIWTPIIKKFKNATYTRQGNKKEYELKQFKPRHTEANYEFKTIEKIPTLILTDFNDENAIAKVVKDNQKTIMHSDDLIIDVRNNAGGSDMSYFPLLPFIFNEKIMMSQLNDETMSVLYSKRNCDLRIEMFTEVLETEKSLPEHIVNYIKKEIELYKENKGKGFITIDNEESFDFQIEGKVQPKRVYILIDQYCGSSGDSFAKLAKLSPKVTLIGRNTMGVLDYSNVAYQDLDDDFTLMYPTSRMNYIDDGLGIDNIGIPPDIEVKWSPTHLKKDMDIEMTLNIIKRENEK